MKHALVTGGSDGLGKATARALKAAGFAVTILAHHEDKTRQAAEELGVEYVVADVSNYKQVELATKAAIEKSGPVDVLIVNAGFWIQGALDANSPEEIEKTIDVNVLGAIYPVRALIESMKERGKGRIIFTNSQGGFYGKAERAVYTASKWAVTGFTKSLQPELKPFGIAVTGFYPGAMATGFFEKVGITKDTSKALQPDEAAAALVYIATQPSHIDIPELGMQNLEY